MLLVAWDVTPPKGNLSVQEETCALVGYKASDASTKPLVFIEYLVPVANVAYSQAFYSL